MPGCLGEGAWRSGLVHPGVSLPREGFLEEVIIGGLLRMIQSEQGTDVWRSSETSLEAASLVQIKMEVGMRRSAWTLERSEVI